MLENGLLDMLIQKIDDEETVSLLDIAAALAFLAQAGQPLFPELQPLDSAPREHGLRSKREKFESENSFGLDPEVASTSSTAEVTSKNCQFA